MSEHDYLKGHSESMRSPRWQSTSEKQSYQCYPPRVHCFFNGQFECECGDEQHDEVLAEMILMMTTVESYGRV
jgi:hypothetical protein